MARRKKADAQVEEVPTPDFDLALRIYRQDIKPAISNQATHAQEASEGYKAIDKRANVNRQIAKFVFKLMETEEAKRDVMLRDLNGLLAAAGLFKPVDLVDVAEGKGDTGQPVVPTLAQNQSKPRGRPQLAAVPSDDSDLLSAAE